MCKKIINYKMEEVVIMDFYVVLGERLPHSISPQIHEKIFELLNIDGAYKILLKHTSEELQQRVLDSKRPKMTYCLKP